MQPQGYPYLELMMTQISCAMNFSEFLQDIPQQVSVLISVLKWKAQNEMITQMTTIGCY